MNEDLHQIDDLFRSGLDGKEDSPSPIVWENIERELDKKERKPVAGFFRTPGKAAAILLLFLGSAAIFAAGYFLIDINGNHKNGSQAPNIETSDPGKGLEKTDSLTGKIDNPVSVSDIVQKPVTAQSQQSVANVSETTSLPKEDLSKGINEKLKGDVVTSSSTATTNNKPASSPKNKSNSKSSKPSTTQTDSDIDQGQIDGSAYAQIIHEPASVSEPISSHEIPKAEKKLDPGKINAVKKQETSRLASPTNIPVANKKAGKLDLPRFSITPVVIMQTVSNNVISNGSRWGKEMKEGIDKTEHLPNRLAGGVLVEMKITRSLTLQSGITLTQKDVHIDPKKVWAVKDIDGKVRYRLDCSAGTYYINPKQGTYPRPGDMAITDYSSNSLNYLNIPLSVKWHFGSKQLQLFTSAGVGLNLLTSQSLEATLQHQYSYSGGRVSNLKTSFFNGMIGAGLNYSFSKKIGLNVNPQYQFALTPMNENMPVTAMPRTFSLQMGLQLKLK
jgi:hypothetical protein